MVLPTEGEDDITDADTITMTKRNPHKPLIKLRELRASFILLFGECNPAGYWVGVHLPGIAIPPRWYPRWVSIDIMNEHDDRRKLTAVLKAYRIKHRNLPRQPVIITNLNRFNTTEWLRYQIRADRFSEYYTNRFHLEAVLTQKFDKTI